MTPIEHLSDVVINNDTEGPAIWNAVHDLLVEIETILEVISENIAFIGTQDSVSLLKGELIDVINDLSILVTARRVVFSNNLQGRNGGYGKSEFFNDIDLLNFTILLNRLFEIGNNESDSYLLNLLDSILREEDYGLLLKIDDTSWTPENQVNGKFPIEHFNITDLDIYDSRNRKSNFETFATGIENTLARDDENSLKEVIMRMLSQFVTQEDVDDIISNVNTIEWVVMGERDSALKELAKF